MNLHELTLKEQLEGLKDSSFSSTELTNAYLSRIKKIDKSINSYITVTEETALEQAEKSDKDIKLTNLYCLMVYLSPIRTFFVQKTY